MVDLSDSETLTIKAESEALAERYLRRTTYGRGRSGGGRRVDSDGTWKCRACTFDNSSWLTVCEMCGTTGTEGTDVFLSGRSSNLSAEELRPRRIARYSSR